MIINAQMTNRNAKWIQRRFAVVLIQRPVLAVRKALNAAKIRLQTCVVLKEQSVTLLKAYVQKPLTVKKVIPHVLLN